MSPNQTKVLIEYYWFLSNTAIQLAKESPPVGMDPILGRLAKKAALSAKASPALLEFEFTNFLRGDQVVSFKAVAQVLLIALVEVVENLVQTGDSTEMLLKAVDTTLVEGAKHISQTLGIGRITVKSYFEFFIKEYAV